MPLTFSAVVVLLATIIIAILVQLQLNSKKMRLSQQQKEDFVRDGFIILRGAVPSTKVQQLLEYLADAERKNQYSIRKNTEDPLLAFYPKVQESHVITDIVWKTSLFHTLEELYGPGNVTVLGNAGQIAFRPRQQRFVDNGFGLTKPLGNAFWHVDDGPGGKYVKGPASFTVLLGVALSPGQEIDENRGQLNVWPGSHTVTHPILCKRLKQGLTIQNGETRFGSERPELGESKRVLLAPGDVVLAHQRLAHAGGINLVGETRKTIYFRIKHKDHENMLEKYLESNDVFMGFEGLRGVINH